MNCLLTNSSWPVGRWRLEYNVEEDCYYVYASRPGPFILIAKVYSSLVANYMIAANNVLWSD